MTPERAYQLLVGANPVPDPDAYLIETEVAEPAGSVDTPRRPHMDTDTTIRTEPSKSRPRSWLAPAGAVAMVVVAAIIGLTITGGDGRQDTELPPPATEVGSDPIAAALAATDAFYAALTANDIQAVAAATHPEGGITPAEALMWSFNATLIDQGYGLEVGVCTAEPPDGLNRVAVQCPVTMTDPVFAVLGIADLTMPFDYLAPTGRLLWKPMEGGDFSAANQAMADYLKRFHPEAYATACDPAAHGFEGVVFDRGLAFTAECAELLGPALPDIATWIEAGRPER